MTPPVLFIRKAVRADIVEAFGWYEERSVGLGHEFLRAVRVGFRAIASKRATRPYSEVSLKRSDRVRRQQN